MKNEDIEKARQRFDLDLHTHEYRKIHSDDKQLESLLNMFHLKSNGNYLDLGTGNGYVAFALAKRFQDAFFTGLDIAEESIKINNKLIKDHNLKNIIFKAYDGLSFSFDNSFFDGIISRYAFHHFPEIDGFLKEINRVIKNNGFFILSDPITYSTDSKGFIDEYQKLKEDGHQHFYYKDELLGLFEKFLFYPEKIFYSYVRYPRPIDIRYEKLLQRFSKDIKDNYKIEIIDKEIFIEVQVINVLFRKTGDGTLKA
ncbi:MAG: methyltransferase domain-containing protein [Spirochaetales bacterium]|nr:methyltransferase domain-containing protein [Spirochaetales bacterium]